jgi:hypothetical protein
METSKEVPVISIEEFKKDLKNRLTTFEAVKRFKSINRAIKRGLVFLFGKLYSKSTFNNRENTCRRKNADSRETNTLKKTIYGKLKYKGRI